MVERQNKKKHQMKIRVYYEDTDCGGVVYYANYLKFLERGRTEWLRENGVSLEDFHRQGLFFAVTQCEIKYRSSARYDDLLDIETELIKHSRLKMVFQSHIIQNEAKLCASAKVTLVCVLAKNGKPIRLPSSLLDKLERNNTV